jgi:hypothetical protein
MRSFVVAALVVLASVGTALGQATFPPGSRIGLAPPRDMTLSTRFAGFENPSKGASITLAEMPAEAYGSLERGLTDEQLRRQGLTVTSREAVRIGDRTGFLISGDQAGGTAKLRKWVLGVADPSMTAFVVAQALGTAYPEIEMQAALRTVALRAPLPIAEQVAALTFKLGDQAGFRPVRVISGNALMLTEGSQDIVKNGEQPVLVIASSFAPPPPPGEHREQFARAALASNKSLKNLEYERSQPFRQGGQDWHEIVARAIDAATGQRIVVMQTIRFTPSSYIRAIGIARLDQRDAYLPRFRKVIDSVTAD